MVCALASLAAFTLAIDSSLRNKFSKSNLKKPFAFSVAVPRPQSCKPEPLLKASAIFVRSSPNSVAFPPIHPFSRFHFLGALGCRLGCTRFTLESPKILAGSSSEPALLAGLGLRRNIENNCLKIPNSRPLAWFSCIADSKSPAGCGDADC